MSYLREFLGNENHPASAMTHDAALAVFQERHKNDDEHRVALEHFRSAYQESVQLTATMDLHVQLLSAGLEAADYSKSYALAAAHDLARIERVMGMSSPTVGLEAYSDDDLSGYYTLALESFKEKIKAIATAVTTAAKKLVDTIKYLFSLDRVIDAATARLTVVSNTLAAKAEGTAKVKVNGKVFNHNGKAVADLPLAVSADATAVEVLSTTYTKLALDQAGAINEITLKALDKSYGLEEEAYRILDVPLLHSSVQTLPLSGLLGMHHHRPMENDEIGVVARLNRYAENVMLRQFETTKTSDYSVALTAQDVESILTSCRGYIEQLTLFKNGYREELKRKAQEFDRVAKVIAQDASPQHDAKGNVINPDKAEQIRTVIGEIAAASAALITDSVMVVVATTTSHMDAALSVCEKAVKQLPAAELPTG